MESETYKRNGYKRIYYSNKIKETSMTKVCATDDVTTVLLTIFCLQNYWQTIMV